MWIKGNYRRNLMDMHIDDWNEDFLSKLNPAEYVKALKNANVQAAMVKAKPHTGLCYWPSDIGRMHGGLHGWDFFGETVKLCHENGIAVIAYFTQIFDNWAFDEHPEWRSITAEGKNFREYRSKTAAFKSGRYGIVCPNNEGYRQYVKANLEELNRKYDFEGMFLDMTFWPDICYCDTCKEKYRQQTGKEMPVIIDWNDPDWVEFQQIREEWIADYAKFATACVKAVKPNVTVEHQLSMITAKWRFGSTELLTEAVDYTGGDYYGGFLEQTFINKYYSNVSPNLPFIYHTSRCDPDLGYHTTTKTPEELFLHVITALVHNGAFLLVDAINPDGTFCPEVYDMIKGIYDKSSVYEKYINGNIHSDVAVWFATRAKINPPDNGHNVSDGYYDIDYYVEGAKSMASILRQNNVPYDIVGSKNLKDLKCKTLVLSHVSLIRDEEMRDIEKFVADGGNLYVSGPVGHKKLYEILGIKHLGKTEHDFTYMKPNEEGKKYLKGFTEHNPLTLPMSQELIKAEKGTEVLATVTLPYTPTLNGEFAAIHSNPPGIDTDYPAITRHKYKKGTAVYTAATIERTKPYMSRNSVYNLIADLTGEFSLYSNAPYNVEIISWDKDGKQYISAINQQEIPPFSPVYEIYVDVKERGILENALFVPSGESLRFEKHGDFYRIYLPKLELFCMAELIWK